MNKKAWIRIAEAFIAIILITGVLLVLYTRTTRISGKAEEIYRLQESILDEIASDNLLREEILNGMDSGVRSFIATRVPSGFSYDVKICEPEKICEMEEYLDKEIFSTERIISSTLEIYGPKKLKIFMWES